MRKCRFFDGAMFPINVHATYVVHGNNKYDKLSFGRTGWKVEAFSRPSARRDYYSLGTRIVTSAEAEDLIKRATRMTLGEVDWLID